MSGIHQKIKFGDIIYIALGERINMNLSSTGFSLKNYSNIDVSRRDIACRENSCLKDYEDDLFVVLPTMNENFLINKLDLDERINSLSYMLNITDDSKSKNDINQIVSLYQNTKKDVYEQNKILLQKIGHTIIFGENIILIHLKSLMFMSTEITHRNSSKKKNNSILLTDNYSDECIFKFDCHKSNEKGEREVFSNQNIYIRKCEKNIWANNPYLYYENTEVLRQTRTRTNLKKLIRKEIDGNMKEISLLFTENSEIAKPFQIKIFSNYIDPSSPCLSFCNPFLIVCQSIDKYIVIKDEKKESLKDNVLQTDESQDDEDSRSSCSENNYAISLLPVEKEKASFNINGLFCVEQIDTHYANYLNDLRMSPYIEFNNVIRFRHVATKKYLAFIKSDDDISHNKTRNPNTVGKNDTIFNLNEENSDRKRLSGTLTLKDVPDEDCNWIFMESYIILDREEYEKAKLEGMEYKSFNNKSTSKSNLETEKENLSDNKNKNTVKKKEILRIFHLKSKRFLSFEDMFGNNTNNTNTTDKANNLLKDKTRSQMDIAPNSNPNEEPKSKLTITLNKQPVDNDLFRLIHSSEVQSREMYLILNLTETFFNLVVNSLKKDITSFLKELEVMEEHSSKPEHGNKNDSVKDTNHLNVFRNQIKHQTLNLLGEQYIPDSSAGIADLQAYKKNWDNLRICFDILRDFCLNNFEKRYDYSVPTGKPISTRQEFLFEQGFLQITLRFLEHANNILTAYEDFQKISEQKALKLGSNLKTKDNVRRNANNKHLSIFALDHANLIPSSFSKLSNLNNKLATPAATNTGSIQKSELISSLFKEINNTIKSGFEFITAICKSNQHCKEYVFKRREIFWDYLLTFKESSECLIEIIKDDENFINEIVTASFKTETDKIPKSIAMKNNNFNLIERLINYMNNSKTYDVQSLTFLSKLLKFKNKGITSNQDEIFQSLLIDKKEKFLLKITPKFNDKMFYIVFKTEAQEYECRSLMDLCKYKNNLTDYEANIVLYLSAQLNLYADMCYGRNYTCIDMIREKFPLDLLIYHISNMDIYEPVLAGMINILNTTYIDIAPHSINYPSMIRYVDADRFVRSDKTPVKTFIPLDKLNMILCLSLFNLFNLKHEKYYINTANIELINNLISFRLYENVEYLDEELDTSKEDNASLKQSIHNHHASIPNLKEEIRKSIEDAEKSFLQGKLIVDTADDPKMKKKQYDKEQKSKRTSNSFFERIGFKFFEYSKKNEEIGSEYLIYVMNFVNDFFLDQIVLRSIDTNMENKNIIAETFKSISRQDILTQNNMSYLMKTIVKIKHILSSNFRLTNDQSIMKNQKLLLINSMINSDNPKRKVLILPMVKKISKVIDVILNIKIENTTDCILDNLLSENRQVVSTILKEDRLVDNTQDMNKKFSAFKIAIEEFDHRKNFKDILMSDEYYLYQLFDNLEKSNLNSESEFLNTTILKTMQELIVKMLEINVDESMIKSLVKLFTRLSSQRKEIINYLKKIRIITDKSDLKIFFLCEFLAKELSLMTEKTEIWMNVDSCKVLSDQLDAENSKFGFISNAIATTTSIVKKFKLKNKSKTNEFKLVNYYITELIDMFIDKQHSGGYIVYKSEEKIKLIQTILFSLQMNDTLFGLLGEVCQVYKINENDIDQGNQAKRKTFIMFKKILDDLIKNIFNLIRCLVYKSENFQEQIEVSFLHLKSNEFLFNLGFIKILKEIVTTNPKFGINNSGFILDIVKKECNVKIFYKLFENIKHLEEYGKILETTPTKDLGKVFRKKPDNGPKIEIIGEKNSEKFENLGNTETAVKKISKIPNLFLKLRANSKLNQNKQSLQEDLTKFYKILKLMNSFVRSVKEERYIAPLIRQYEEIIKTLALNESFAKITASDKVSPTSKEILRIKMKIFSQLIKISYNLIRVNEKLKELIRKVFPVRILEERILSLEMQLDIEKISVAIKYAKDAIDLNKQKIKLDKPGKSTKRISNLRFAQLMEDHNEKSSHKQPLIEFQNIPKIFQGIFSFGDVEVDLTFIYLIKNFFKTKYHGSILFFLNGLDAKKKDLKTIQYFFEILARDVNIYEEIKDLFEAYTDSVFTKIIRIFKKNSFKYFFKGIFKIISSIVGYINQDLFNNHADYMNFILQIRSSLTAYKNVFKDFILEEDLELPEYKSLVQYINENKEYFQEFFMNFSLAAVKREEKIGNKFDKALNDLVYVKKIQIKKIISFEKKATQSDRTVKKSRNKKNDNDDNFFSSFTKNQKYSEILKKINREEYFKTPYGPLTTLTIALTGDILTILDKLDTKTYIENEIKLLAKYLNNKVNYHHPTYYYINNNSSLDNYIQPSFHLMNIILKFVQESYLSKRHSDQVILLIKLFTYFIEAEPEFAEAYHKNGQIKSQSLYVRNKIADVKEMCFKYRQNLFIDNGSVEVFLKIICEINQNFSKDLFGLILKFFNMVLAGGNKEAQEKFYELFDLFENSENLFYYLKQSFNMDIFTYLKSGGDKNQAKKDFFYLELMKVELKFLQNLTENHFVKLQNYIREQTSNKVSYNFVSIIVEYMNMLLSKMTQIHDQNKLSKKITSLYYDRLISCLETLCEFLQGPCKLNQETLVHSKVIEIFDKILRETECIELKSEDLTANEDESSQMKLSGCEFLSDEDDEDEDRNIKTMSTFRTRKSVDVQRSTTMNRGAFLTTSGNVEGNSRYESIHEKKKSNSSLFYLLKDFEKSMLIYKIGLVLLAAIEGRKTKDEIMQKLLRDFDLKLIYKKLTELYLKIKEIYNNKPEYFLYFEEEEEEESSEIEKKKFVVESGFTLYVFLSSLYEVETEDTEFKRLFQKILKKSSISRENYSFENRGIFTFYVKFKKAMQYFKDNCLKIEVFKDDEIQTVYFPKLNFFKNLTEEMIKNFREKSDITSVQTKLVSLLSEKEDMYRSLKQLYGLELYFEKLGPLKYLFKYPKLLLLINITLGIIINIMILLSYTTANVEQGVAWIHYTSLFGLSYNNTRIIFGVFGAFILLFSSLAFLQFMLKTAPLMYRKLTINLYRELYHKRVKEMTELEVVRFPKVLSESRHLLFWKKIKIIVQILSTLEVIYSIGYIAFTILALAIHNFFFSYHLIEFIKSQSVLRSVLKSVYNPRKQIFFIFAFFLVLIYFYVLIVYYFFYDVMPPYSCDSMLSCLATVYSQTFTQSGALGNFIQSGGPNYYNKNGDLSRYILEISYVIIIVWLVFQIISGLIYDTFSSLRKEQEDLEEDFKNVCFICGLNREVLEKYYKGREGFDRHLEDHNVSSYFCYIFYLKEKNASEYSGIESYVQDQIELEHISWIPVERYVNLLKYIRCLMIDKGKYEKK